jgi:hypothetical protein
VSLKIAFGGGDRQSTALGVKMEHTYAYVRLLIS